MTTAHFTPKAQRDLSHIWDYTLEKWGEEQAEIYVRMLYRDIENCAQSPQQAVLIEQIRKGYRKLPSGSHVIFFNVTPNGIDVVRILHKSMDFSRHL